MGKRGQISVEYLIVVGFVVAIVVGMLAIAFFYTNGIKDEIKINQIRDYAGNLVSTAETIFFAGEPSRTLIELYLPGGVQSIEILDDEVVITATTSSGTNIIGFPSDVPLDPSSSFSINEGVRRIQIIAGPGMVSFSEG